MNPPQQPFAALPVLPRRGWRRPWFLPEGRRLPDPIWQRRHRGLTLLLLLHLPALAAFAWWRGWSLLDACVELLAPLLLAAVALTPGLSRAVRSTSTSLGLVVAASVLVHLSGGSTEAHFHFFVIISFLTLYQAWSPFLVALAYVVLEHGLLGALDPVAVYGNPSAAAHPWRWALIHGGFILAASFGNILSWRLTEQESLRDSLTGLPNRARLLDVLNALLAGRGRTSTAVLFLDLDGFKDLNDGYGHHTGDELLRALARRLAGQLGPGQLLARLGGDEFAVVLEDADCARAIEVGERLLAAMASPFVLEAVTATLGASIGVTCCDEQTRSAEDLLRQADLAMYASKRAGGGSVATYAPELQSAALSRFAREAELRAALEQEQFLVYLQPILDVALDTVTCVEALVRWQHPAFGLLAPGEFIATAEQCGLIVPLGRWVLEQACQAVSVVNASRPDQAPLTVSVNLSPKQLTDPDLLSDIARALQRSGLPPSSLCLEITESTIIDQPDTTIPVLEAIRALGISFSLDDFGTGYSSLSYLKKLPVSTVKIDRTFVTDLGSAEASTQIVLAIISLAHALGLNVTAEGVETAEQAQILRAMGCDNIQGYLLSPPLPPAELNRLLAPPPRPGPIPNPRPGVTRPPRPHEPAS